MAIVTLAAVVSSTSTVAEPVMVTLFFDNDICLLADTSTALNQHFVLYQGEQCNLRYRITDNGVPVDVNALTDIQWKARRSFVEPTPVIVKNLGNGGITRLLGTNIFVVAIDGNDTGDLVGYYWHELRVSAGKSVTGAVGRMNVKQSTFA